MAEDRPRQHAWRTAGAPSISAEPGKSRRGNGKRLFVLAVALAIVGVVVGFLTWPNSGAKPIFLGIVVTQYDNHAYPPNPWAQADGEGLRPRFETDSALATQAQEKKAILDQIVALADRTGEARDKGRPVVVYLNAFAIVHDGKVHVLPGRADPDNAASCLPLEEILAAMRRGTGSRLLLLDLAQPIADAHTGIIANELSTALNEELVRLDQSGDLKFLVLTSCGKGQISHISLELQKSVFGFFLDQGMVGHADGWNAKKQTNGQVSALELVEYTIAHVADWADQHHLAPQIPQLYGKDKDFVLISPRTPYPALKLPEAYGDYPKWLADGWKERDAWIADGTFRRLPRTFRQLEVILLRAERRWLAGDPEDKIKPEFDAKFADLGQQKKDNSPKSIAPHSIAQARRQENKDQTAIGSQVHAILGRSPLKPDDLKPLVEKPPEPAPFGAIAYYTLETLLEPADPPAELLKNSDQLLKSLTPPPRFTELAMVRLLVELNPKVQEKWNEPGLLGVRRLVLDSARAAESAAAIDPRALPWVKDDLAAADELRRNGLLHLATGGIDLRQQGLEEIRKALKQYDQVEKLARALERAWQRFEEARSLLPGLVSPLGNRVPDSADEQLWASLIASTGKLQDLLTPPKAGERAALDEIVSTTDRLQSDLARIRLPSESVELNRLLRRVGQPNGPSSAQLRTLLDSPLWSGPDRVKIYVAAKELGQTMSAEALAHAAGLAPGVGLPASNDPYPDAPAWRAKLAIDLLKLNGMIKVDRAEEMFARAKKSSKAEDWREVGRTVRNAWAVALPEKYKETLDLPARERAGWILDPLDIDAVRQPDQRFPGEPSIELLKKQSLEFWQWLARERYLKDADLFQAVANRSDLNAYGKAMKDVGLDLQARAR